MEYLILDGLHATKYSDHKSLVNSLMANELTITFKSKGMTKFGYMEMEATVTHNDSNTAKVYTVHREMESHELKLACQDMFEKLNEIHKAQTVCEGVHGVIG